jgi:hypothetical protein
MPSTYGTNYVIPGFTTVGTDLDKCKAEAIKYGFNYYAIFKKSGTASNCAIGKNPPYKRFG